jgi:hypothetical protein
MAKWALFFGIAGFEEKSALSRLPRQPIQLGNIGARDGS